MSETIILDTPEQINAWVLASRISQAHLHMDGLKVPGLAKWIKANVPDVTTERTVRDMYPRLLDFCDLYNVSAPGGERCNYQVLMTPEGPFSGLYFDCGIFASIEDITAPVVLDAYKDNRVVVLRTMEEPRDEDISIRMVLAP